MGTLNMTCQNCLINKSIQEPPVQRKLSNVIAGYLSQQKTIPVGEESLVSRFPPESKNKVCWTLHSCQAFYHQSLQHGQGKF